MSEENVSINANQNVGSVLVSQFLTKEQCNAISKQLVPDLWVQADLADGSIDKEKRNAFKQFLPISDKGWPIMDIIAAIKNINQQKYQFDLSGIMDNDGPVVMKYNVDGHYDWHIDIGKNVSNRKISFIIQLTDPSTYEGGDIEVLNATLKKDLFKEQGNLIIFPSYIPHKIHKITKGERVSIVGWIHGNSFK